jgi:hypothetical protein
MSVRNWRENLLQNKTYGPMWMTRQRKTENETLMMMKNCMVKEFKNKHNNGFKPICRKA